MSTKMETNGFLSPRTVDRYLDKVLSRAGERNLLFSDVDQTLVDSRLRFQLGQNFNEVESLMETYPDKPKEKAVEFVKKLQSEGWFLVLVSGRRRSLKTLEQMRELGLSDFFFIRNSKLYNPDLSSRRFKRLLGQRLRERISDRSVLFFEDRADIVKDLIDCGWILTDEIDSVFVLKLP